MKEMEAASIKNVKFGQEYNESRSDGVILVDEIEGISDGRLAGGGSESWHGDGRCGFGSDG